MDKYISKKTARDVVKAILGGIMEGYKYTHDINIVFTCNKKIQEALFYLPDADVVERKTARWESQDAIFGTVPYVCSNCGEKCLDTVMMKPRWKYCPMCGAQMTEGR